MGLLSRIKSFFAGTEGEARTKLKKKREGGRAPKRSASFRGSAEAVVEAMLVHAPPPLQRTKPGPPTLARDWTGFPKKDAQFIERNAHALLFGVIMDRMVEANMAWLAVSHLAERLGHLDVDRIADMDQALLAKVLGRWNGQKSLHRFPPTMAKNLIAASRQLREKYGSDAANIWAGDPGVKIVRDRLLEFDGISEKLAHMTLRILITSYGVKLTGWEHIDVAVDRHLARVFLRTGLIEGAAGQQVYRVAEIREQVLAAARRLSPSHPGALDEAGFFIGKQWCTTERARCRDPGDACPLEAVCPKERKKWNIRG